MEENLDSTYTCYIGIFSMLASITFNILYTSKAITKYETHIANLEKRLESFLQKERNTQITLFAQIQDLENKLKKLNKKTNEIDAVVNVFIEDSNEILDYIEENINSFNGNNKKITM